MDGELQTRISHPLKQVRERAIESITFKLKSSLLKPSDLIHEKQMLSALLAQVSNNENSEQAFDSLLYIVLEICQYPSGCSALLSVRGKEIFDSLQQSNENVVKIIRFLSKANPSISPSYNHHRKQYQSTSAVPLYSYQYKDIMHKNSTPLSISRPDSPVKRSVVKMITPPYLPNAIKCCDPLYLSPVDKEIVEDFANLIKNTSEFNPVAEQRLFDIICIDFGSQIFLQRSSLFRSLLMNLESENADRMYQTFFYLQRLIKEWGKVFKEKADTFSESHSATTTTSSPIHKDRQNLIPKPSTSPTFSETHTSDYSISIPFACQELFIKLVPVMRILHPLANILKILYECTTFLTVHIDTICTEKFGDDEVDSDYVDGLINFYMGKIVEVIGYLDCKAVDFEASDGENGKINDHLIMKDKVMLYGISCVQSFSKIVGYQSTCIWTFFDQTMNLTCPNFVPTIILYSLQSAGSQPSTDTRFILNSLILHSSLWVRLDILLAISSVINDDVPTWLCDANVLNNIIQFGFEPHADEEIRKLSYGIIKRIIEMTDYSVVAKLLDPLQGFYEEGEEESLLDLAIDACKDQLVDAKDIWKCFWWKGLLHRSERFRKRAFNELLSLKVFKTSETESFGSDPWNVFVFSPSFLSIQMQNLTEIPVTVNEIERLFSNFTFCGSTEQKIEILSNVARIITDNIAQRRAIQLNIIDVLLDKFKGLLVDPKKSWLANSKEGIISLLNIIRTLVEGNSFIVAQLKADQTFLKSTISLTFHEDILVRYAVVKLMFAVLFDVRNEDPTHHLKAEKNLVILPFVKDSYHIYSPAKCFNIFFTEKDFASNLFGNYLIQDSDALVDLLYRKFSSSGEWCCLYTKVLDSIYVNMKACKSPNGFSENIHFLSNYVTSPTEKLLFGKFDLVSLFKKFLLNTPGCESDTRILDETLRFVTELLSCQVIFKQLKTLLIKSLSTILIPLLEGCSNHKLEGIYANLAESIVVLTRIMSNHIDSSDLVHLASTSPCLLNLRIHAEMCFSSDFESDGRKGVIGLHQQYKLDALQALLPIISMPSLVMAVSGDIISETISLYVSIIGRYQQLFINFTNGDSFSYQDRCCYKWTVLSLRNISRSAVVVHTAYKPWVWGSHWLFNNDMDWVVQLLNDDEKILQKMGLGILGNLILIKGSYEYLCVKIPQFLDMAFSYALDFDRNESYRKESILIINNFLITFCHDNKMGSLHLLPYHDESFSDMETASAESSSKHSAENNPVNQLLKIFEHFGFFDYLPQLFDISPYQVSYRCALTALLLNMSLVAPDYLRKKISDNASVWELLLNHLDSEVDLSSYIESASSSKMYQAFIKRQFKKNHQSLVVETRYNTLQMFRLLLQDNETQRIYILQNTDLTQRLLINLHNEQTGYIQNNELFDIVGLSASILSDILWDQCQIDPRNFEKLLGDNENIYHVLQTCLSLMKQRDDHAWHVSGCTLLAKITSLHYGEIVDLGIDQVFDSHVELGTSLVVQLIEIILNEYDAEDAMRSESVRISLQCFFGKCVFAKKEAISSNLLEKFVVKMNKAWNGARLTEVQQKEVFVIVTLLRHLMAGSTEVKSICAKQQIHDLLFDILFHYKDISNHLLIETLCCLRNFVSNFDDNKKIVLNYCGAVGSAKSKENELIDVLVRISKNSATNEVFNDVVEIFKLLSCMVHHRNGVFKLTFLCEMKDILRHAIKQKETGKIEQLLKLFIALTSSKEGQTVLIKVGGILSELVDLLTNKSINIRSDALALMRNLACTKENKAHFLNEENFLSCISTLFYAKASSPKIFCLTTSLIWVLLYDCEKAKVAFKKANFKEALNGLENRLSSEYGIVISSSRNNVSYCDQEQQAFGVQDQNYLADTCENLLVVRNLLRI